MAIAAAETPNFSSRALTTEFNSSTVIPSISLTKFSAVIAISLLSFIDNPRLFPLLRRGGAGRPRLVLLLRDLLHHQRQVTDRPAQHGHQAPQRRLEEDEESPDQLFPRGELCDHPD